MWKYLAESVAGTSHAHAGQPCQDHCLAEYFTGGPEAVLVLAGADGAGSAQHAGVGAERACQAVVRSVHTDLAAGARVDGIERDKALAWVRRARQELEQEAERRQQRLRDFACTLLLAVVADRAAVFAQVGDGAIVRGAGEEYRPIFWPEAGEYVNCTFFLTDPDFEKHLAFALDSEPLAALALFTDGLQRLALDYSTRTGYAPFLAPLFRQLREAEDAASLAGPLRQFLDSPRINQRTDDDKTLILATRVAARDASTAAL
jgi:hypothetical protein